MEFIFATAILLLPMIYLVLAASALEAGSYAVVSAADQAAKVYAVADTPGQARSQALSVVDRALGNFGFSQATTNISCSGRCLSPGSVVTIEVSLAVPLPVVSDYVSSSAFTVNAVSAQRIDRFG